MSADSDVEYWMARCHNAENRIRRVTAFRADKIAPTAAELAVLGDRTGARALSAVLVDLGEALKADDSVAPMDRSVR